MCIYIYITVNVSSFPCVQLVAEILLTFATGLAGEALVAI